MEKLKCAEYQTGSFIVVYNTILLVIYNSKGFFPHKLKIYAVHWYHMYILHPGMDQT